MGDRLLYAKITYLAVAIVAFGSAWHDHPRAYPVDVKLIGSTGAAIFWPLYLSAKLWHEVAIPTQEAPDNGNA